MDYEEVGVVAESQRILLKGLNPWQHDWVCLAGKTVQLPHPQYKQQMHEMRHYTLSYEGQTITFAAGEVSMNVWGFYLVRPSNTDSCLRLSAFICG